MICLFFKTSDDLLGGLLVYLATWMHYTCTPQKSASGCSVFLCIVFMVNHVVSSPMFVQIKRRTSTSLSLFNHNEKRTRHNWNRLVTRSMIASECLSIRQQQKQTPTLVTDSEEKQHK
jgi:hypothetical protein